MLRFCNHHHVVQGLLYSYSYDSDEEVNKRNLHVLLKKLKILMLIEKELTTTIFIKISFFETLQKNILKYPINYL
jgi:hypothetical protein